MCELFGVSAKTEFTANGYLEAFYSRSDNHPHGWGLARVLGNKAVIDKERVNASNSEYLRELLKKPVTSKIILAHIRYATIGNVEYRNCHPFTGKDLSGKRWTLVHNGTIFDFPPLNPYVKKQKGDTDSERILLYLIDVINAAQNKKGEKLNFSETFELLDKTITEMSKGNKLNLIFTDGSYLFVHTNCKDTLHYLKCGGALIFATKPLDKDNWQDVPFTRLLAFRNGKLVKSGTAHSNVYIENEEAIRMLYQIFANL